MSKRKNKKNKNPKEPQDDKLMLEGTVEESLPNAMFKVVTDNGMPILATISGKIRKFSIKILVGDRVSVEVSPYDPSRGRITFRHK